MCVSDMIRIYMLLLCMYCAWRVDGETNEEEDEKQENSMETE